MPLAGSRGAPRGLRLSVAVKKERARDCYRKARLVVEWEKTVRQVCAAHFRKTGFISGFQALAAGAKRTARPGFLERARVRWGERHGGSDS